MDSKITVIFMILGGIAISSRFFEVLVREDIVLSIVFGLLTLGECIIIERYIFDHRKDV